MGLNNQWMQRDLAVLWHPCTQMKDHQQLPLIPIKRGEGVWLEDFEGKRYRSEERRVGKECRSRRAPYH